MQFGKLPDKQKLSYQELWTMRFLKLYLKAFLALGLTIWLCPLLLVSPFYGFAEETIICGQNDSCACPIKNPTINHCIDCPHGPDDVGWSAKCENNPKYFCTKTTRAAALPSPHGDGDAWSSDEPGMVGGAMAIESGRPSGPSEGSTCVAKSIPIYAMTCSCSEEAARDVVSKGIYGGCPDFTITTPKCEREWTCDFKAGCGDVCKFSATFAASCSPTTGKPVTVDLSFKGCKGTEHPY